MPTLDLRRRPMVTAPAAPIAAALPWLWDGYLMPGDITLLTSQWKTGKTTLLAGLLQSLGAGTPFLGRATHPGRAWVVSEESESVWDERLGLMPVGVHVELLSRPFQGRPTVGEWNALIDQAVAESVAGRLDLVVVDPLASFLTGRCESDAATLLEALQPLHRLAKVGLAVLLLHHPRKLKSAPGNSARGSGALLGFVDTSLELGRYSGMKTDGHRRLILGQSRRDGTPARLAYEWNRATGAFAETSDPRLRQFEENWQAVREVLKDRRAAISHREIAEHWPADADTPVRSTLYAWMQMAFDRKLVRREGKGTSRDPWRYRLPNEADAYRDRGELPPLEELGPLY